MSTKVLHYLSVYFTSTLKFIGGIGLGTIEELSITETAIFTFLGAMTTVIIISTVVNTYRKQFTNFFSFLKKNYYRFLSFMVTNLRIKTGKSLLEYKEKIRKNMRPKRFTKTIRIAVKTWNRFGIIGIAFLTPLILSPIGGASIAVSFRVKTSKTIFYMAIFNLLFAFIFAFLFYEFKDQLEHWGILKK